MATGRSSPRGTWRFAVNETLFEWLVNGHPVVERDQVTIDPDTLAREVAKASRTLLSRT